MGHPARWTMFSLVLVACAKSAPPPEAATVPAQPPQPGPAATQASTQAAPPVASTDRTSLEFLQRVAENASHDLPKMLDKETREELVTAEAGALVYHNRLVNKAVSQLSVPTFERILRPSILEKDCTNKNVRAQLLDHGVKLRYSYIDRDGTFITTVDVTQADCP